MRLDGVDSVSEKIHIPTHTCEIRTKKGLLPNREKLARCIHNVGDPFTLYGLEARVEGRLTRQRGDFILQLSRTGERVRLGPLSHKVQWDRKSEKEQAATFEETAAYERLVSGWKGKPLDVQVTGPLTSGPDSKLPLLQVREFSGK